MEDAEALRRALFDAQTRNFVLENQVADLAGGRDSAAIHEELLSTRTRLAERERDVMTFEKKLGTSKEEVRQLKQLLLKLRGTLKDNDERIAALERAAATLADELAASAAAHDETRERDAHLAAEAAEALCAAEALAGALSDTEGDYDVLLSAHRDYTSEIEATRQTTTRSAAHEREALSEATGEVARLRLDGSKLRGRVAALEAEVKAARLQAQARERAAKEASASAVDAVRAAAVLEVKLTAAVEDGAISAEQLARARADADARADALSAVSAELERERAQAEAAARRHADAAKAAAEQLAAATAEGARRQQRCVALDEALNDALSGGGATRDALDAARAQSLSAELSAEVQLRALGADLAALETAHAHVDGKARSELAAAHARAAVASAKAELDADKRVKAAEAAQAKLQRELDSTDRRLADATQRLGASAKHANQLRALQAHVAELNERLEKKTALAERLLKRHGPGAAEATTATTTRAAAAAAAAEAADASTPRAAAALQRERAADPPSAPRSAGKENADAGLALPVTTRSSSRARSGPLARPTTAEPGRRGSGFVVGTVPRRASGCLVMPARQSERSVLTPRAPKTARATDSPPLTGGKGSTPRAADAADPPAPEPARRKSGVKVVPSRYLDTTNITTRSR